MLFDLNVPWPVSGYGSRPSPQQLTTLRNTVATLSTLGYTHIAINFTVDESVKIPLGNPQQINPIAIGDLRAHFGDKFPKLRLFTRLTLVVSDPSKFQSLSKISHQFDILAIQPTTEKALQLATANLDIDLISINLNSRLPFFLKHKTVGSGLEKGIKYEIAYAGLISGYVSDSMVAASSSIARRNFFGNVLQLIRASRSRGLVISSGALQPVQTRNYSDILTLLGTVGLDNSQAKTAVVSNPESVLISGRLRIKSYKQTVLLGNDPQDERRTLLTSNEAENPARKTDLKAYKKKLDDTASGRLLKKQRTK